MGLKRGLNTFKPYYKGNSYYCSEGYLIKIVSVIIFPREIIMKSLIFGLSIFGLLTAMIFTVIFYSSEHNASLVHRIFMGFLNINDFVTSFLIVFGFIIALLIYLSNRNIYPNQIGMNLIENMPDFLPFKHSLQSYLSKLIKKNFKILVLIRPLDEQNYEWVLNQVSAYNSMMDNPSYDFNEMNIEFLFVKKNTSSIETLINELDFRYHDYIILTGLSAIFRNAILAREELPEEKKKCVQIIGSLSSIQNNEIQKIIDTDDKIIRIFPPDYDEAKTAINFIFSKIKNSICPNHSCSLHGKKHNIIVIHNGTYGRAIRNQCEFYFDEEFLTLDINTSHEIPVTELKKNIQFHSFDYKSDFRLLCDKTESDSFDSILSSWEGAHNHFYIIGYEPNVSSILTRLDTSFNLVENLHFSLLFAGTASMNSWRKEIIKTLEKTQHLSSVLKSAAYYMKLHSIENINHLHISEELNLVLHHYNPKGANRETILMDELKQLFPHKHVNEHTNFLKAFWQDKNNYITTFTSDSLRIARYAIKENKTLLESKFELLRQDGRNTQILVNGDSINQYTVKLLEE